MTVADLIAELRRVPPHLPVRIFVPEVDAYTDEGGKYHGRMILSKDCDWSLADIVRYEGSHVLIEGKA